MRAPPQRIAVAVRRAVWCVNKTWIAPGLVSATERIITDQPESRSPLPELRYARDRDWAAVPRTTSAGVVMSTPRVDGKEGSNEESADSVTLPAPSIEDGLRPVDSGSV